MSEGVTAGGRSGLVAGIGPVAFGRDVVRACPVCAGGGYGECPLYDLGPGAPVLVGEVALCEDCGYGPYRGEDPPRGCEPPGRPGGEEARLGPVESGACPSCLESGYMLVTMFGRWNGQWIGVGRVACCVVCRYTPYGGM